MSKECSISIVTTLSLTWKLPFNFIASPFHFKRSSVDHSVQTRKTGQLSGKTNYSQMMGHNLFPLVIYWYCWFDFSDLKLIWYLLETSWEDAKLSYSISPDETWDKNMMYVQYLFPGIIHTKGSYPISAWSEVFTWNITWIYYVKDSKKNQYFIGCGNFLSQSHIERMSSIDFVLWI